MWWITTSTHRLLFHICTTKNNEGVETRRKKNSFIWKYRILWLYTIDTTFPEDGYWRNKICTFLNFMIYTSICLKCNTKECLSWAAVVLNWQKQEQRNQIQTHHVKCLKWYAIKSQVFTPNVGELQLFNSLLCEETKKLRKNECISTEISGCKSYFRYQTPFHTE